MTTLFDLPAPAPAPAKPARVTKKPTTMAAGHSDKPKCEFWVTFVPTICPNQHLYQPHRTAPRSAGNTTQGLTVHAERSNVMATPIVRRKDLAGQRFGRWVVIGPSATRRYAVDCRCDCGTIRDVLPQSLKIGRSLSCGCIRGQRSSYNQRRNPERHSPEYIRWRGILDRCLNPNCVEYHNYGGRGITVCERWKVYENFLADMGRTPADKPSVDRINVDGPYSPENCRWASQKEQMNNRRCNVVLEWRGERLTAAQWSERLGIHEATLHSRLRHGWSVEAALGTPVNQNHNTQGGRRG